MLNVAMFPAGSGDPALQKGRAYHTFYCWQYGRAQAKVVAEASGSTGVVLTKLDGSAKGGIVISVQKELGVPVKLVGLGEGPDD